MHEFCIIEIKLGMLTSEKGTKGTARTVPLSPEENANESLGRVF